MLLNARMTTCIRAERHKTEKKVVRVKSGKKMKYKPEMPKDLPMVAEKKATYKP